MRKILLLIILLLMFMLPSASALSFTQSTIYDGETLSTSPSSLHMTVTGMDTGLYTYSMVYGIGQYIWDYPKVLDGTYDLSLSGDMELINFTASTFNVPLHPEYYPFDHDSQTMVLQIYERYKSNNTLHQTLSNTTSFNITGSDDPSYTTLVSIKDCDPYNLDFNANRIVDRGLMFTLTGLGKNATGYKYQQIPFTIFLTDNASNILAYGTGSYYYSHNDTYDSGTQLYATGIKWKTFTWAKTFFTGNYSRSYFIYIGIPLTDGRTEANTYMSLQDGTMYPTNFSTDGFTTAHEVFPGDLSKTYDYVGGCIYFETRPTLSSLDAPVFTIGMIGSTIRQYSIDMGLPWFYLIIAFVILALFFAIPWKLSLEYDLHIPNFIYGILAICGMTTNMMLYLIEFWMYAIFICVMVLMVVLKYREDIEKVVTTVSAYRQAEAISGETARSRKAVSMIEKYRASGGDVNLSIDKGVRVIKGTTKTGKPFEYRLQSKEANEPPNGILASNGHKVKRRKR